MYSLRTSWPWLVYALASSACAGENPVGRSTDPFAVHAPASNAHDAEMDSELVHESDAETPMPPDPAGDEEASIDAPSTDAGVDVDVSGDASDANGGDASEADDADADVTVDAYTGDTSDADAGGVLDADAGDASGADAGDAGDADAGDASDAALTCSPDEALDDRTLDECFHLKLRACNYIGDGKFRRRPIQDDFGRCEARCALAVTCTAIRKVHCREGLDPLYQQCIANCSALRPDAGFVCGALTVWPSRLCDGLRNCNPNGEDELGCESFHCADGELLTNPHAHCDGRAQCKDKSDELGCALLCPAQPDAGSLQ